MILIVLLIWILQYSDICIFISTCNAILAAPSQSTMSPACWTWAAALIVANIDCSDSLSLFSNLRLRMTDWGWLNRTSIKVQTSSSLYAGVCASKASPSPTGSKRLFTFPLFCIYYYCIVIVLLLKVISVVLVPCYHPVLLFKWMLVPKEGSHVSMQDT